MYYPPLLFIGAPGWMEILLILVVILLLFGAKKLPEVMGSFGKGVREFKKGISDLGRDSEADTKAGEKQVPSVPKTNAEERKEGGTSPDGAGS